MTRLFVLALLLSGARETLAADYCSLIVRIVPPPGKQQGFEIATVSVQEENGRIIKKETEGEDVRFCDLGITSVTVTINDPKECYHTTIREVPLDWMEEYLMVITLDWEHCNIERLLGLPCKLLLRIKDANGKWIAKASVRFDKARLPKEEADNFGRILLYLDGQEKITGTVFADGYSPSNFSASCLVWRGEQILTLKPVGAP